MEPFWEPNGHAPHAVKYESDTSYAYCSENGLNFSASTAAYSEDDADFTPGRRGKASRQDPLSHRIIEKRRRDRMNSCLADLSRLIPTQYQRKGRGRIEKTEIIEMSIRYMKQLQNQEYIHKENLYKMGYEECLQQAANFLYNGHRDVCYQMVDHLKEVLKGECFKSRNHTDSVSASSGSPQTHSGSYHPIAPLNQLRDMLATSDHEHSNSIDHNDVKDLSIRGQPQQAPVITSTAPAIHLDTISNHDFDSSASRSSSVHMESSSDHSPHAHGGDSSGSAELRTVRMRKLSDSCHHMDSEHNNNSYKFKNYIQQRFSQDTNHHDDMSSVITDCSTKSPSPSVGEPMMMLGGGSGPMCKKPKICIDFSEGNSCDEKSTNASNDGLGVFPIFSKPSPCRIMGGGSSIGTGGGGVGTNIASLMHNPVPIFALHSQGRFYVPLNIEYDTLVPYLGGIDLLEKNCAGVVAPMPPLHAININVNFSSVARMKGATTLCVPRPKSDMSGW